MKEYQPAEIRNFAIVGHASAGKTVLGEAMLACAGQFAEVWMRIEPNHHE